jgi:hypothetical protein
MLRNAAYPKCFFELGLRPDLGLNETPIDLLLPPLFSILFEASRGVNEDAF